MTHLTSTQAFLDFAVDAAWQAGQLTLAHFQTGVAVEQKADESPVTIADRGAERLLRRLIEDRFPDLRTDDSPTQRVAGFVLDRFPPVTHAAPMLSLDSSQEVAALRRFDARLRKAVDGDVSYVLEPKLDGASVELVYEAGASGVDNTLWVRSTPSAMHTKSVKVPPVSTPSTIMQFAAVNTCRCDWPIQQQSARLSQGTRHQVE